MTHPETMFCRGLLLAVLPCLVAASASQEVADEPVPEEPAYEDILLRGKVVWMSEALRRLHNVHVVPEAAENLMALETAAGELHPIVEDTRGRAFRRDSRLRGINVEMLVRRHRGSPMLQVIRLFELSGGKRLELDYWCEICAIAMFELKPCDCCQGPIELRRRLVEQPATPPSGRPAENSVPAK